VDEQLFADVDQYIENLFVPADPVLSGTLQSTADAGMPEIQISPCQGKLLYLLAKLRGARRILELGTLAGYSTIWLARALPEEGRLISLEYSPDHASVARANLKRAGLESKTEVIVGPAIDSLAVLESRGEAPFDVVFIDADKPGYSAYLKAVLRLSKPGTLIMADNLVRGGAVLDANSDDELVQGVRAFNAALGAEPRVESIVLQLVGSKGYDGLSIGLVKG